jgi:hypothetical protein
MGKNPLEQENAKRGGEVFQQSCAFCHGKKNLLTAPFAETDWASHIDRLGRPIPAPEKEPQQDGVLVHANVDGATNWMAPSFDPETRLFYVNTQDAWSLWYLVPASKRYSAASSLGRSFPACRPRGLQR